MTRQSAPSAELERLQDIDFAPLDRAILGLVEAQLLHGLTEQQEAQVALADVLGDVFVAGDLMGRRRVELEIGGGRIAARAHDDLCESVFLEVNRRLPRVSFREAIANLLSRVPRVARSFTEIARLYREGPAFAATRAANQTIAKKIRDVVGGFLREGKPVASARSLLAEMTGWSKSYSENVYRTNLNTAYTSGRFAHAQHEDIRDEFPVMRFAAVLDGSARPHHAAAHGLIAPTHDPIWNTYAPPLGYQCRCTSILLDRNAATRAGAIQHGVPIVVLPRSFRAARPDPGFGGRRPGLLYAR